MKSLIIISMLAVLVSCNSSSKSSKRSCTYNDEPIECEALEGSAEAPEETGSIVAEASSAIRLTKNEIEILENAEDEPYASIDGETKSCFVGFEAGFRSSYKISGHKLIMTYEAEGENGMETHTETYSRSGLGNDLMGTWVLSVNTEDGYEYTKLKFTEKSVKSTVECHFYR